MCSSVGSFPVITRCSAQGLSGNSYNFVSALLVNIEIGNNNNLRVDTRAQATPPFTSSLPLCLTHLKHSLGRYKSQVIDDLI